MANDPSLLNDLAALLADSVPPSVLATVVDLQGVVPDYENMVKEGGERPADNDRAVARRLVDAYAENDRIEDFVRSLIRHDAGNARFVHGVADLLLRKLEQTPPAETPVQKNKQAAIAQRAQMLRSRALREFLEGIEGRICVVAAELKSGGGSRAVFGTGFLVGPDLVLTARHVLKDHILAGQPNPMQTGRRCVFFDHLDGPPIIDARADAPPGARCVEFDPGDWLLSCSDELMNDGLFDPEGAQQIAEAQKNLDYVLIRLAQPVGNHSRRSTGGVRRGWIELWSSQEADRPASRPDLLATDDRIIIPQHPGGHPQQIDFGRYNHSDPSQSRIRYDTETDEGTSGAPCFDQNFTLVGVHNAYYEVLHKERRLNQAIRFDHIHRCLRRQDSQPVPAASRLWSVSDDESDPMVLLGRAAFLAWIDEAGSCDGEALLQRAFFVEGRRPRCGKTFSTSILRAARRERSERILALGRDKDSVPQNAADFLRIIAAQLRIPDALVQSMPERPATTLPGGGDGDKLVLWYSRDLAQWLIQALAVTRLHTVDVRQEAIDVIAVLRKRKIRPTPAELTLSELPEARYEQRSLWDRVWIVLDDVSEEALSAEVKALIASLLEGEGEDGVMSEELRRLRWIFLGWRPTSLEGVVAGEMLDQLLIGNAEIEDCLRALVDSLDQRPDDARFEQAMTLVGYAKLIPQMQAALANPDTRLTTLQQIIGTVRTVFRTSASPAEGRP